MDLLDIGQVRVELITHTDTVMLDFMEIWVAMEASLDFTEGLVATEATPFWEDVELEADF